MTAEYHGALWVPAHASRYTRVTGERAISHIVVHGTSGHAPAMGTAEMWAKPPDRSKGEHATSAHFVVGRDPSGLDVLTVQAVALRDIAAHAHAASATSIGVEHCIREPGEWGASDAGLPPYPALYAASARLVAWLCRRYGLPPTREAIVGHAEIDPATSHRGCPTACGWDWRIYMALVEAEYGALAGAAAI